MAVIAQTTRSVGSTTLTRTTLGSSDTLTYNAGTGQILNLANNTGGSLTVTITGSTATTYPVPGSGGTTINLAAGKAIGPIAASATAQVNLDELSLYLQGTITVTGGTGITATLVNT